MTDAGVTVVGRRTSAAVTLIVADAVGTLDRAVETGPEVVACTDSVGITRGMDGT